MMSTVLLAGSVGGSVFETDKRLHITNLHQINDDLYAACEKITIDGAIEGDLLGAASSIVINGHVFGSANIFAQDVRHSGRVDRTLRAFGMDIEVGGFVGRALLAGGLHIEIGPAAVIEQGVNLWGQSISVSGTIRGNASTLEADTIIIDGTFEGDVSLKAKQIRIKAATVITGNLTYETIDTSGIEISDGAIIEGETVWVPCCGTESSDDEGDDFTSDFLLSSSKLLAAFLFGIIIVAIFRRHALESFRQLRDRFSVSLASGFLALLGFAFSLMVLAVSLVLMVVGLIVSTTDSAAIGVAALVFSILMLPITSFTAVSGGIIFYAGKIVMAFLIGYWLVRIFKTKPIELGKWQLLVGLIILTIIFAVPVIGFFVYLLAAIAGAGAIVLSIRQNRSHPEAPSSKLPQPKEQP
ncbi:MAG: hypothetical protein KOO62_08000 [candidate division Zixibacteria bacterium]|nr:hypothetical protein [candidate division Zixibacteria bacterium]